MGLIAFILVGASMGWLASKIVGRHHRFLMNLIIGIIGSLLGNLVIRIINADQRSFLQFSWTGIVWSLIGAIILLGIAGAISSRNHIAVH